MKKGFFIVFLLVCVLNVESQVGEIQELEDRIELLEARVLLLEKAVEGLLAESEAENQTLQLWPGRDSKERNINVWRKLKRGMSKHEAISILGEAKRVEVSSALEIWYYGNGGILWFDSGSRLDSWSEPMY